MLLLKKGVVGKTVGGRSVRCRGGARAGPDVPGAGKPSRRPRDGSQAGANPAGVWKRRHRRQKGVWRGRGGGGRGGGLHGLGEGLGLERKKGSWPIPWSPPGGGHVFLDAEPTTIH